MSSLAKCIALVAVYLFNAAQAYAEEPQRRGAELRLGGFVGGGFTDWVGKDVDYPDLGLERVAKPAFSAGVQAALSLSRLLSLDIMPIHLALQPEFVYANKGARLERDGEYRGASTNMGYLQAGLLLRTEYTTAGRVTPYVVLGPELGYLYSAKFETGLGNTVTAKDDYKSTDFGLILGLGTMFELPHYGALGLELRGDLGLVSIDGQGDGDEIRNAALTLLLAYLY